MMIRTRPDAEAEIEDIGWGYEDAKPGLGRAFIAELDRLYRQLVAFPTSCPEVDPGIRRGLLSRFPYAVYYAILDDGVEILAVVHQARHERAWKARLD